MKKIAIFLLFAGFVSSAKSQATPYLIDYTNNVELIRITTSDYVATISSF